MSWNKTPPTKPGDYRNREHESEPHCLIEVRRNQAGQMDGRLAGRLTWHPLERFEGEWYGPLVHVDEVELIQKRYEKCEKELIGALEEREKRWAEEVRRAYYEGIHSAITDEELEVPRSWETSRARRIVEGELQ